MSNISPIFQNSKIVNEDGFPTVEFKRYMDDLLARVGGIPGGSYSQLTDAASIVWDLNQAPIAVLVLGGNRAIPSPLNQVAGAPAYRLTLVQDATGNRLVTWGSAFKFASGTPPVLSTAANAVDELWFSSDGTNMKECVFSKDIR